MDTHKNAALTPKGREAMVRFVIRRISGALCGVIANRRRISVGRGRPVYRAQARTAMKVETTRASTTIGI
jgi:hypothetical protein